MTSRQFVFLALVVLLIGAGLRLTALDAQSLWNDEGNSLRLAQRSVPDLIDAAGRDIHPPGYYLALKGWIVLAGESETGLRTLSALQGLLTVAVAIGLGRSLFGPSEGVIGGLLVALSPFAIDYSQETRMYAQLALLAVTSMAIFVRWLAAYADRSPRPRLALGFALALVNAAGLYTHYAFPFTMATEGVLLVAWLFAHRREPVARRVLGGFVALNLLTLVIFAPWLPTAWDQVTSWPSTGVDLALDTQLRTVLTWITFGNTADTAVWIAFAPVLVLVLAAFVRTEARPRPSTRRPLGYDWRTSLLTAWIVIVTAALFISGAYRAANLKFLLPAQIALALLLARGTVALWSTFRSPALRWLARGVAAAALVLLLAGQITALDALRSNPAYARDDYRAIASRITRDLRPGDAIILDAPNQAEVFTYYYDADAPVYELPQGLGGDDAATRAEVEDVLAAHDRLFVLFWGEEERDPRRVVRATLDSTAYPVSAQWYGDVEFALYAIPQTPPTAPPIATDAAFGADIRLEGYALSDDAPAVGDVLGVTLFWQTNASLDTRYKVAVQLLAPDGSLVAQHDAEPANNGRPTLTWTPGETVIDPHGLVIPPEYEAATLDVIAVIYTLDAPYTRLPVTVDGAPHGDALRLVTLELAPLNIS